MAPSPSTAVRAGAREGERGPRSSWPADGGIPVGTTALGAVANDGTRRE